MKCEVCGRSDAERPIAYKYENFCSENCRKKIEYVENSGGKW